MGKSKYRAEATIEINGANRAIIETRGATSLEATKNAFSFVDKSISKLPNKTRVYYYILVYDADNRFVKKLESSGTVHDGALKEGE